jgi:hypothetical protein
MQTFYDRYMAGEHQQVWSDLIALGEAVRQEPVYSDAQAVARETMRRAQANIERLIDRLHAMGYRFHDEQSAAQQSVDRLAFLGRQLDTLRANTSGPLAEKMKGLFDLAAKMPRQAEALDRLKSIAAKPRAAHPLENSSIYSRANDQAAEEIADAERRLGGPLPLSLKAWYEVVEHVSLSGSHPELNPIERATRKPTMFVSPAILEGPAGQRRRQLVESLGFRVTSQAPAPSLNENPLPDPLVIAPLDALVGEVDDGESGSGEYIIAPDDLQKADISGGVYAVALPDGNADVVFPDWKGDYFVAYLRRVFAWGGFPGWERHGHPPSELIRELTHDLTPL